MRRGLPAAWQKGKKEGLSVKETLQRSAGARLKGLFCLGLSAALAVGVALNSAAASAKPVQYDVKVVSSATHTAALSSGDLYGWGTNAAGQLPGVEAASTEAPVKLASGVADVAVSKKRSLVVSKTGELRSYGVEPATGETAGAGGTVIAQNAAQVAAADDFAAYIDSAGALYLWGQNASGQLGNGGTDASAQPVRVFSEKVKKVSLGDGFALALMENGAVYGWGLDDAYQIGVELEEGASALVLSPVQIATGVADIATGKAHSVLLKKNGSVWTCGDTAMSQTGYTEGTHTVGVFSGSATAQPHGLVQILTGIRGISAGAYHNFAVATDGTVYAWGFGVFGQLGNGETNRYTTPTETEFTFAQVFACEDSTFGVETDGSIYSFGSNLNYVLGKSDGSDSLTPLRILDRQMNWVFDEIYETAEVPHGADGEEDEDDGTGTSTGGQSGEETGEEAEEEEAEEESEPEIVSTPFISGDGQGHFLPGNNVTRAEFLRMVVSGLCQDFDAEKDYGTPSFSDVQVGRWYENYVAYAEKIGLVVGDGGKFRPNDPITKAEAAVIVYKSLNLENYEAIPSKFLDVATDRYFTKPIDALTSFSILSGDGTGYFYPMKNLTRAEAVTVVAQAAGYQPDASAKAAVKKAFAGKTEFTDIDDTAWYYPYLLRGVGYVK